MKLLIFGILVSMLCSCSSIYYYPMETIDQKMTRFRSNDHRINFTPDLAVYDYNYSKKYRGIASANIEHVFKKYSNKSLYFISLMDQFHQFNAYLDEKVEKIKTCPRFHSIMIRKNFYQSPYSDTKLFLNEKHFDSNNNKNFLGLNPEFNLPLSYTDRVPKVIEKIKNGSLENKNVIINQAIKIHTQKTKDELSALCENGKSENFYIFANIMKYKNDTHPFKKNIETAKILLGTTIIGNQAILASLIKKSNSKPRGLASNNTGLKNESPENEVLTRIGTGWFKNYMKNLGKFTQSN